MNRKSFIMIAMLMIAFITLACGIDFNLLTQDIKTGPVQTQEIEVELPASTPHSLNINFGAGNLDLSPGAENGQMVTGEAIFNVSDLAPVIKISNGDVEIASSKLQINGIPKFQDDIRNEWNLRLTDSPLALHINGGAYKGNFDFGNLSLTDLEISDGASDVTVNFSKPNLTQIQQFSYETGASRVKMKGLSNANFINLVFRSGAGNYLFDFSGDLKNDATVLIETGLSKITIVVPQGVSAEVQFTGELKKVDANGKWEKVGSKYIMEGTGPKLIILVKMSVGSLQLIN